MRSLALSSPLHLTSSPELALRSSASQLRTAFRGETLWLDTGSSCSHPGLLSTRRRTVHARASGDVHSLRGLFKVLGLAPSASKLEIKRAYRRLALKYHPDVCKGDECSIMFQRVAAAYEAVLNANPAVEEQEGLPDQYVEELMGVGNDDWEDWEEWMGWEGAGTYDFSPLINSRG